MPIAVFKSVREVSSEDPIHVAENLLKEQAAKKWKTKSSGEKCAYIILEFAEPQQITGIDIGNEHAAFVEVLVSKSGCAADDFKELLLSSSFMTPIESKNSSNTNRVRCFSGDALAATSLPDKWKLVKILCTQPFNKHVQYGVSFIKVHVNAVAPVGGAAKPKSLVPEKFLGQFKLREDSPDSESDGQAALFQRWKASRNDSSNAAQTSSKPSTAAAIRDAAAPAALRRLSGTRTTPIRVSPSPLPSAESNEKPSKVLDRNRESLLFGDDDDDESDAAQGDAKMKRMSRHIEADKNRRRVEQEKQNEKPKRNSIGVGSPKPAAAAAEESKPKERSQKRLSSPVARPNSTPAKKQKVDEARLQYRPFNQLLRGVVLVISGIQNPDRADLRSKATALGAKYKADWETGCTHLICAFKNTPKYNQVRGKGKIVTRSWIEKCYDLKKYLPWRRYALDTAELGHPESDEELLDESLKPPKPAAEHKAVDNGDEVELVNVTNVKAIYDVDDTNGGSHSGTDTEDELERVAQKNKLNNSKEKDQKQLIIKPKSQDVFEISTEEEDFLVQKRKELLIK